MARICASDSVALYDGMLPRPLRSALATRAASGLSSSSTGPTAPSLPASFSVWHSAQAGVAC